MSEMAWLRKLSRSRSQRGFSVMDLFPLYRSPWTKDLPMH
jgi:hypothetical protein